MRKLIQELNFMTFTAEIRVQITDLPLKLFIWPIGSLVSIHRSPLRNPSATSRLMPHATFHAVSADLTHYLDQIKLSDIPAPHLSHLRQTAGANPGQLQPYFNRQRES